MIKNLGRFKQWTGEKFGGAKVTLQTDDFQKLEQETEHRREGYENIVSACDELHRYLLKKKTSPEDNKNKLMPYESFGTCLYHYSSVFPHDSALAIALVDLGQTQTRIAALQEVLASEIKNRYMSVLENGLQEYKDYDALRKKLELKRLDYDSKLNRLNKAKKEKPELEQEMQGAKMKYEDTEHDLIQKMAYLQEFENEHRDALFHLLEAECDYHTQAKELLESIKKDWGQGSTSDPTAFMSKMMMAREESTTSSRQNSPSSIKSEKVRKASFDFSGQNDDEISFKIGDLITVIDEIDRGWWVGEANGKRGIFPVNFTEEYDSLTKEFTQHSNSSSDSVNSPKISQPRRSSSIRQRPPPPPPSTSSSYMPNNHSDSSIKRASNQPIPMTHTVSAPDVISRNSMPPPPPTGLSRHRSTAIRPPPPPPPVRSNTIDRVQRVVIE
ncbi:hypothetical protein G6F56_006838 [Rhizopus delemar]|nr:hypothetical protein G6F56_006838 [Rhizopus delemar]